MFSMMWKKGNKYTFCCMQNVKKQFLKDTISYLIDN